MAWWRKGVQPNDNDPADVPPGTVGWEGIHAGDPDGVEIIDRTVGVERRGHTSIVPSPWAGWPADWATPRWGSSPQRLEQLVDVAWECIDKQASILSSMPVYRIRNGRVIEPRPWMSNPDPDIYQSWEEFAKQLFWDYQTGEVFVLPTAHSSDGYPARFRVVRPWLVNAEMIGGRRRYSIGSLDVTDDILPIRYQSTTDDARGHGPLEAGDTKLIAARVLGRYVAEMVQGGIPPNYVLTYPRMLTATQAADLLAQWDESRRKHLGKPAIASGGLGVEAVQGTSAKDMTLLEVSQYTEARISSMIGMPPPLIGLPGGDSLTYANRVDLYDEHDRVSLRPKSQAVMSALSQWAEPAGTRVELNRDEYTRPAFADRIETYAKAHAIEEDGRRLLAIDQMERMERFLGAAAPEALTGGARQ